MGGSSVKPLHGPWGLTLFPCSKATCPCLNLEKSSWEEITSAHV